MKKSRNIFLAYFIFYFILGIYYLINKRLVAVDAFIAAAFCLFFIYINKKYSLSTFTAFIAGFIFMPHIIGVFGLYGYAKIHYHYDWIAHFTSTLIATIAILNFLYSQKYFSKRLFSACLIALSVIVTFGAFMEMSEYWGFRFIGFGEGYLGFGQGDNSQNFGPWENSSLDTTFNFVGSLFAVLVYALYVFVKKRQRK
jgi:hypothetical protein